MTHWTLADTRRYYADHAELLVPQLTGRLVRTFPPGGEDLTVKGTADFLTQVDAGIGGFAVAAHRLDDDPLTVDRLVVRLLTGLGADIATTAMSAQAVAEQLTADGYSVVAVTDGAGGLILIAPTPDLPTGSARSYLDSVLLELARRAPEIATTVPGQSEGRVLLDSSATDPRVFTPVPYSLVSGAAAEGPAAEAGFGMDPPIGVVMPVTLDEISAASAGMPMEHEPDDLLDRLQVWGDLASLLHRSTGPSA